MNKIKNGIANQGSITIFLKKMVQPRFNLVQISIQTGSMNTIWIIPTDKLINSWFIQLNQPGSFNL